MNQISALALGGLDEIPGICLPLPAVKNLEAKLASTRKQLERAGKK